MPVAVAPSEAIAEMWQEMLRDEGIRSMVKGTGAWPAFHIGAGVEHVIYVLASDADRAREILGSDEEADESEDDEDS